MNRTEKSPSPVYAEVHKDRKKKKQWEDNSVVVDEREKSQSPEYAEVVNKHSKDILNQKSLNEEDQQHYYHSLEIHEEHGYIGNQEDEQHYYYSLEIPEEHGCSGNNIVETVYTSEDSQDPNVITNQSTLCEAPDTNTHTELVVINTFPNPCYGTKMASAD